MEDHLLLFLNLSMTISISTSISSSMPISISISIPTPMSIYLKDLLSSRWYSNPKPPLNQARIYSTSTLYKEILNQHDDNIQWIYCASLCLNLPSTCFQGACRVVYTPWASHSTQHLACDNRCFQCALGGEALRPCFCFWPVPKGHIAWVLSTLYIRCQGPKAETEI